MKKEEIRNNPLRVYLAANIRYTILGKPEFYIEIELGDEERGNLYLVRNRLFLSNRRVDLWENRPIAKSVQEYDINGEHFFREKVQTSGKVWVERKGKETLSFNNYEEFLDAISDDQ